MPATSLHKPTNRWLTSFRYGSGQVQGAEHSLSIGHPISGGEFTTYRLAAPVAHEDDGAPLFDLDEAEIEHEGIFYSRADLYALIEREYVYYGHGTSRPLRKKAVA